MGEFIPVFWGNAVDGSEPLFIDDNDDEYLVAFQDEEGDPCECCREVVVIEICDCEVTTLRATFSGFANHTDPPILGISSHCLRANINGSYEASYGEPDNGVVILGIENSHDTPGILVNERERDGEILSRTWIMEMWLPQVVCGGCDPEDMVGTDDFYIPTESPSFQWIFILQDYDYETSTWSGRFAVNPWIAAPEDTDCFNLENICDNLRLEFLDVFMCHSSHSTSVVLEAL